MLEVLLLSIIGVCSLAAFGESPASVNGSDTSLSGSASVTVVNAFPFADSRRSSYNQGAVEPDLNLDWKTELPESTDYLVSHLSLAGNTLCAEAYDEIIALDADNGAIKWRVACRSRDAFCPLDRGIVTQAADVESVPDPLCIMLDYSNGEASWYPLPYPGLETDFFYLGLSGSIAHYCFFHEPSYGTAGPDPYNYLKAGTYDLAARTSLSEIRRTIYGNNLCTTRDLSVGFFWNGRELKRFNSESVSQMPVNCSGDDVLVSLSAGQNPSLLIAARKGHRRTRLLETDLDGTVIWSRKLRGTSPYSLPPVSTPDGRRYYLLDRKLYCFKNRKVVHKIRVGKEPVRARLTAVDNGIVVAQKRGLYVYTTEGKQMAAIELDFPAAGRPVVDSNGRIFVAGKMRKEWMPDGKRFVACFR